MKQKIVLLVALLGASGLLVALDPLAYYRSGKLSKKQMCLARVRAQKRGTQANSREAAREKAWRQAPSVLRIINALRQGGRS